MKKQGFTLIELLIVMAIIAILAVGLIAALDPLEQIRKGTDTGVRSTATEFKKAVERYYAATQKMPWCDASGCNTPTGQSLTSLNTAAYKTAVNNLINAGELKSNFLTAAQTQLPLVFITEPSTGNIISCFLPTSKSFQSDDTNTIYNPSGGAGANCGTQPCYWCIQ